MLFIGEIVQNYKLFIPYHYLRTIWQNICRFLAVSKRMSSKPFRTIGIFEGAYHNEVLEAYVFHLLPLTETLYIFTHTFQWEQAVAWRENDAIQWFLTEKNEKTGSFLQKNHKYLSSCAWLITTSLPEPSEDVTGFRFPCPAWLVIHNTHYFFSKPFSFLYIGKNGLRDILKILRYLLFLQPVKNKKRLAPFSNIIFPTENTRAYFLRHFPKAGFPDPAVVPFCRVTSVRHQRDPAVFHIVVPGSISRDIRDYDVFLSVVPVLLKKTTKKIRLTFLGKPKDATCSHLLLQLNEWQHDRFEFGYGKAFIPQTEFEKTMLTADVLVAPLHRETRYDAKLEYFGFSTESGNIADIVKYQLPAVLPAFYPLPENLDKHVLRYDNAESLTRVMLGLTTGDTASRGLFNPWEVTEYQSEKVAERISDQWYRIRLKNHSFAHDR